jgi:mannose-1-phosphate guanylyltransferase
MKAFLLAAGKGTRLRPLTDRIPKCLVPIGSKPLLEIWLEMLRDHGITDVLVNTHHLAGQVEDYVMSDPVSGVSVTLFHEPELLGSAGTVRANRGFVDGEDKFLIIYADNLTTMNLTDLLAYHDRKAAEFTVALFRTPAPTQCGIAVCDGEGRIIEFQEKPQYPQSDWANAGLYVAGPELFGHIPDKPGVCDFGFDVLPSLCGTMYGYFFNGFFCDTGTPERLAYAREEWVKMQGEKKGNRC